MKAEKRPLLIAGVCAAAMMILVAVFCCRHELNIKETRRLRFRLMTVDGKVITEDEFLKGTNYGIVVFADPDCSVCIKQITDIAVLPSFCDKIHVMVISEGPARSAGVLSAPFGHVAAGSIFLVADTDGKGSKVFRNPVCPSTFIYGRDGRLQRSWRGQVSRKALVSSILSRIN